VEPSIRAALKAGYRHFDCALLYGNEAWIGRAFERIFHEGIYRREDVFIATKVCHSLAYSNMNRFLIAVL